MAPRLNNVERMKLEIKLLASIALIASCADDSSKPADTVTATVDGSTFVATDIGINRFAESVSLVSRSGQQSLSVTFPKAAGNYSCSTPQSGVVTTALDWSNIDANIRAGASYGTPGSSCTIEVTRFDKVLAGRFSGTMIDALTGRALPVATGEIEIELPTE